MCKLTLILILLLVRESSFSQYKSKNAMSQTMSNANSEYNSSTFTIGQYAVSSSPLTNQSFNKMMTNEFYLAILGTKTPVNGFKVETTNPSITLSGNIFTNNTRNFILNLELTVGSQDNISQLFSNNKLNGNFKASLGINWLLKRTQFARFNITARQQELRHQVISTYEKYLFRRADTSIIYDEILSDRLPNYHNFKEFVDSIVSKIKKNSPPSNNLDTSKIENAISQIISKYVTVVSNPDTIFQKFKEKINDDPTTVLTEIEKKNESMRNLKDKIPMLVNDSCISIFKDIWTVKRLYWINFSPFISNGSVTLYEVVNKKLKDSTTTLFGIQISLNHLVKFKNPNQFIFGKLAIDLKKANNLDDLQKFNYKKGSLLDTSGGIQTSSEKSGSAYKGELIHSFSFDLFVEFYIVPFPFPQVPGFYFKSMFSHERVCIMS